MRQVLIALILAAAWLIGPDALGQEPPRPTVPSLPEIVDRLLARAGSQTNRLASVQYQYIRRTVIEELDGRGQVTERKVKEHRVEVRGLDQSVTLIKVNDQAVTGSERTREQQRAKENREKYGRRSDRSPRSLNYVDRGLLERFRYSLLSTELVGGRWTFVLGFDPVPEVEDATIADRVVARMHGRMWVDAEEFEAVRIEADLQESMKVGGFLAVLDDLGFVVVRSRLPDGTWVNVQVNSQAGGRKLLSRFKGRMEIQQDQFQPLSGAGVVSEPLHAPPSSR